MSATWPRLSESLPGPRDPHSCASCGDLNPGEMWQECDASDKPESIFILLCKACAKKLIKPHPRLYVQHERNTPFPGMMEICDNCLHRDDYTCVKAKANGGPGILIQISKPSVCHLNLGRLGGRWIKIYSWPAHGCSGRVVDNQKDYGP